MDAVHSYSVQSRWLENRSGLVTCEAVAEPVQFSAPVEFQGEAGRWTPEHFLLAAIATCFVTTFRAVADYSQFKIESLEVGVEGRLGKSERGIAITEIFVRPILTLARAEDEARGIKLMEKAEAACFISHTVRSHIALEPRVRISELAAK